MTSFSNFFFQFLQCKKKSEHSAYLLKRRINRIDIFCWNFPTMKLTRERETNFMNFAAGDQWIQNSKRTHTKFLQLEKSTLPKCVFLMNLPRNYLISIPIFFFWFMQNVSNNNEINNMINITFVCRRKEPWRHNFFLLKCRLGSLLIFEFWQLIH